MIIVGLVIVLAAGIMLLAFVSVIGKNSSKPLHGKNLNPQLVIDRWAEISRDLQQPNGAKHALIEADKMLDYVLKGCGFVGQTTAERLKKAESHLSDKESVWRAHKLRNAMVHEVAIDVVPQQVQHAVRSIGQAINDLGVALR